VSSIRGRLNAALLAGLLVLFGAGAYALFTYVRAALQRGIDEGLRSQSNLLADLLQEADEEPEERAQVLAAFELPEHPWYYEVLRADATPLQRSKSLGETVLPTPAGALETPSIWSLTLPNGTPVRALSSRLDLEHLDSSGVRASAENEGTLIVARDQTDLESMLLTLKLGLGAFVVLSLTLASLSITWILKRGLAPLDRLALEMSSMGADGLDRRFSSSRLPAELAPICRRLDDLLARLQEAFQRERRFNAAVAHELRTPLAELRSMSEVALRWPAQSELASRHPRETLEIAERMERLVSSLLSLARTESGEQPPALEPVDLAALVEEVWRDHEHLAERKHLSFHRGVPAGVVSTDPALMRAILGNLISNAIEYSPQDSTVEARLDLRGSAFRLELSNACPDLNGEDPERFFEPFWRRDASRSSGIHLGLGLTLARAMARTLGCELEARRMPEQRICLALRCPPAESAR
jgi:signal transduction histidine kinase